MSKNTTVFETKFDTILVDHKFNIREDYGDLDETMADIGSNGINLNLIVTPHEDNDRDYKLVAGYRRSKCVERIRLFHDISKLFAAVRAEAQQAGEDDEELFTQIWDDGFKSLVDRFGKEDISAFESWSKSERQINEELTNTEDTPYVPGRQALVTYLRGENGSEFSEKDVDFEDYTLFSKMLSTWVDNTNKVPVRVKNGSSGELIATAILENIDRKSMNALEEGVAFKKLIEIMVKEKGIKKTLAKKQVASMLGSRSLSYVDQRIKLLKLCQEGKDALVAGEISPTQGFIIAHARKYDLQRDMLARAKSGTKTNSLRKMLKPVSTGKSDNGTSEGPVNGQEPIVESEGSSTVTSSGSSVTNSLPPGEKLSTTVHKNEVVFSQRQEGGSDFILSVNGEDRISFRITQKGYVKATSRTNEGATEILNVKTALGHAEIRHDNSTEGQFLVDVNEKTKGLLILDGKGGVSFVHETDG